MSKRAWDERKGDPSLMFIDTTMTPTVEELLPPAPQDELEGMIAQLEAMLGSDRIGAPQFLPTRHGFDHYFGDNVINFPPYAWIEDARLLATPDITFKSTPKSTKEGSWECRPGPGRSDWDFYQVLPTLASRGVDYIRSRKGKEQPFFLYFPLPSPHAPIVPTDEFDGKSKAGAYGDFVVQTDDVCGRLLAAVRECGMESNTIVIFSSDNGYHSGTHRLPSGKQSPQEPGTPWR